MSSLPRSRRAPKATPAVRLASIAWYDDPAPGWWDNWHWEPVDRVVGTDSRGADIYESDFAPEPDGEAGWIQTMIEASLPAARIPDFAPEPMKLDLEWLARIEAEEAAERDRIADTYFPTRDDLADYERWLATLDDATPEAEPFDYTREEWDAIRRCQVSPDELAMLAAGMPVG